MVFTRNLKDLEFDNIKNLKDKKFPESDILDYKQDLISDDELVKHVSAFANTGGGYIIFGIQETGQGGIPKAIEGINKDKINKERTEHILISNIDPRLNIKFSSIIDIPGTDKCILVLQIPNSHLKPHLNKKSGKFHKRYNFSAIEMTEIEISDAYKKRFQTYQELDKEVEKIKEKLGGPTRIHGQIIILPTIIVRDLIDTYNVKDFSWIDNWSEPYSRISNFDKYIPNMPTPSANGVKFFRPKTQRLLEIHRSGAINYVDDYGFTDEKKEHKMDYKKLCVRLLQTLNFAREVYFRYNYFGNLRLVLFLSDIFGTYLTNDGCEDGKKCEKKEILIVREVPISLLETDLSYIASNICDELFNHFQEWKCWLFDENGVFKEKQLNSFE